jgi:hypothetical protein
MCGMTAHVVIERRDGFLMAIGPAARIRPALRGATPLTVDGGAFTDDVVTLHGLRRWGDGAPVVDDIAQTIHHPEHGELLMAYIDEESLDAAPKLTATLAEEQRRAHEAVLARAAAAEVWDRWSQPCQLQG